MNDGSAKCHMCETDEMMLPVEKYYCDSWTGEFRSDEKPQRTPADFQIMTAQCQQDLYRLALDLLDPERFGHAVSKEIRNQARRALGIASLE